MRYLVIGTFALASILLCGRVAFSQGEQSFRGIVLGGFLPPGGGMVSGAPYSALQEFEESQTLSDGTRIVHKTVSKVYRDFQGRTRLELFMGREVPEEPNMIEILDPVNGVHYTLLVNTRVARRTPMGRTAPQSVPSVKPGNPPPPPLNRTPERVPLGTQMIEGLLTQGVRATNTVPVGVVGNDRPLTTVTETWYSEELKVVVLTKRSDPRSTTENRLTNISRLEPSAILFEVPGDYTIEEGRP